MQRDSFPTFLTCAVTVFPLFSLVQHDSAISNLSTHNCHGNMCEIYVFLGGGVVLGCLRINLCGLPPDASETQTVLMAPCQPQVCDKAV